jgi:hypothetical protein
VSKKVSGWPGSQLQCVPSRAAHLWAHSQAVSGEKPSARAEASPAASPPPSAWGSRRTVKMGRCSSPSAAMEDSNTRPPASRQVVVYPTGNRSCAAQKLGRLSTRPAHKRGGAHTRPRQPLHMWPCRHEGVPCCLRRVRPEHKAGPTRLLCVSRRGLLRQSTCGPAAVTSRGALVSQPRVRVRPRQARAAPPAGRRRDSSTIPSRRLRVLTPGRHRDVAHHQRRLRLRKHLGSSRCGVGPGLAGEADSAEDLITPGGRVGGRLLRQRPCTRAPHTDRPPAVPHPPGT